MPTQEDGRAAARRRHGRRGIGKSRLGWEFEKYVDGLTDDVVLAPRPLPVVRRRRRLLGVRRDGPLAARRSLDTDAPARGRGEDPHRCRRRVGRTPAEARLAGPAARGAGSAVATAGVVRPDRSLRRRGRRSSSGSAADEPVVLLVRGHPARRHRSARPGRAPARDQPGAGSSCWCSPGPSCSSSGRRSRPVARATVVDLQPLDDPAMATLVDGLVADLPTRARAALVVAGRGRAAVRRRDGPIADRPGRGGPRGRSLRLRRPRPHARSTSTSWSHRPACRR